MANTLYRAGDQFYLLPDDTTLPAGSLAIRALSGATLRVDPAAARRFQVTEAVARKVAAAELRAVGARLDQTLDAASALSAGASAHAGSALEVLAAQLGALTERLKAADLATPAGRAAVDAAVADLSIVRERAALETAKGELYAGLAEQLADVEREP